MEITDINDFLDYYKKVRKRTLRLIKHIPADKIEWSYHPDKFTFGDLIRHLANTERYMYCENVCFRPSLYPGHGTEFAEGYDNIVAYLNEKHQESLEVLGQITSEDLQKKCTTPGGVALRVWKWLRLMAEHEIHHRGQMYTYLGFLGETVPSIYGLTEQEMHANSIKQQQETQEQKQ
ncbi:MAG TPA: DinB family protein [Microscillaceae bacterium]|nr:DinB family protein [Microscillaceae bacterium]